MRLTVNGRARNVVSPRDTPLLWVLRDELRLTGAKFGCGAGLCGACTVHVDGQAVRACVTPLETVERRAITTIEGLSAATGDRLQSAWIAEQAPQCGYCQSGMIMAAAALLTARPRPSDTDIDQAITNLCRCGSYPRVRRAIHRAAAP